MRTRPFGSNLIIAAALAASHFENGEYAFSLPRRSSNDWVMSI